ncbi:MULTISPECIES: ABC transporter substrate-binding protein [Alphaproteobacteria]|uniref:Periplasmic binding protein n=2 Tax=Alphaproteobacteria TaxID=28211 RepID=A0A512HK90_9HYPH|nr:MULTISPECIES: ABC transporter substrate-binding protein [Alphaproteobacteria]GEO85863.1 periplasmic binding protein [Ciceribacter naphthalenivorans]GLR21719.1 periplasmic binding protein [Ciceribacter naphthalenivorans]GLT04575.1 periplasmic binding protein [Sphingomonas psychrolutea]
MKRLLISTTVALMALATQALADITVTDVKGRTVTLAKPAERVVLGFYYEDFLAVVGPDALDKVVALSLSTWKDWRPNQFSAYEKALPKLAAIPDVGNTEDGTFSVEKVIAARPDLVILAAWSYDALGEGVQQIEAAGIPVVTLDYNAQTVAKHVLSTEVLGKVMGSSERAEKLARNYEAAIADIDARIKAAGPTTRKVYVELAQKGPGEVGNSYGDSMWGALIDKLGGHNIAKGQIGNWGPLSPEYVLAQQPNLVFLAGSEWLNKPQSVQVGFGADAKLTRERMGAYLGRPGWADLAAVKEGGVHAIYHGGSRTLSDYVYAQYIAKQLYPEAFKDVDPAQNIRDYYEAWLPIKADGVFVLPYQVNGQ